MKSLYDELKKYSEKGMYPCHMPGHKQSAFGVMDEEYAKIDFTEAEGLDDLHHPEGIIKEAEEYAAKVLGSKETHFLINGSTAGILSAISACVRPGGKLVLCRGCHKSAYNAMYLRNIVPGYIFPKMMDDPVMEDAASAEDVEAALEENPDAEAVFIVSPTYEGRLADIKAIAEAVHKKGIPLIVDEAHGAHLSFTKESRSDAIRNRADIVIQSVHKTLPAPTQTALISTGSGFDGCERLRRFLSIYQSSSPSYPLMAMTDGCIRYMSENAEELIGLFHDNFEKMLNRLKACDKLYIRPAIDDLKAQKADYGKLLICTDKAGTDGKKLADVLRKEYGIEPEMTSPSYVLLMFTVCDKAQGYEKIAEALLSIDKKCEMSADRSTGKYAAPPKPESVMNIQEAADAESEEVSLDGSEGRISSSFVYMYPPGSPILAPGEKIKKEHINIIDGSNALGMNIKGISDNKIRVVKYG